MKKILVLMLSCCSVMAWAQTDRDEMRNDRNDKTVRKSAQTDQNSLDGRSFRITLKEKTADATSQQNVPDNRTGINTGTIDTRTPAEQAAGGHTDVKTSGSAVITDPNSTRDHTDVNVGGTADTDINGKNSTSTN